MTSLEDPCPKIIIWSKTGQYLSEHILPGLIGDAYKLISFKLNNLDTICGIGNYIFVFQPEINTHSFVSQESPDFGWVIRLAFHSGSQKLICLEAGSRRKLILNPLTLKSEGYLPVDRSRPRDLDDG